MKSIYKIFILSCLALIFSCQSNGQHENKTNNSNKQKHRNMNMYPFDGYYINLDNFERIEADSILADDFKTLSKYSVRFANPFWFEEYPTQVTYNNSKFELTNSILTITDLSNNKIKVIDDSKTEPDNVSGNNFLIATTHGVLWLKGSDENNSYLIKKYNEKGKKIYVRTVEHTDIIIEGNIHHYKGSAETVLFGDILVIAVFHDISTGSELSAFNINTGEKLWEADVKQLAVPHSKYYNKVILSCYENKIIMEGVEAYGHYLQIFDLETGKRLFESDIFD